MKKPTRAQVKKWLAIALMIAAMIIIVFELRPRHSPATAQGWPFVTAGASSTRIVHAGRVQVSRTAIAFTTRNRSLRVYTHGHASELAHYVDGAWQPVPHSPSDSLRLPLAVGFPIMGRGWHLDLIRFDIMHGELPPGRYMFIRQHSRHFDYGSQRLFDHEYMMFEFEIDENTPVFLPVFAQGRSLASAIAPGVIVRVGVVIGVVKMFRLVKRRVRATLLPTPQETQ